MPKRVEMRKVFAAIITKVNRWISGCLFDCTLCNTVCPSGALKRLELSNKQWLKIGEAVLEEEKCRVVKDGVECDLCAKACPVGAIFLMGGPSGLLMPEVTAFHCIGCGACQAVCPMRNKAIKVKAIPYLQIEH